MTDWMLHYAERRTARRVADEAIDEHFEKMMNDEETEHATMLTAARAAVIERASEYKEE